MKRGYYLKQLGLCLPFRLTVLQWLTLIIINFFIVFNEAHTPHWSPLLTSGFNLRLVWGLSKFRKKNHYECKEQPLLSEQLVLWNLSSQSVCGYSSKVQGNLEIRTLVSPNKSLKPYFPCLSLLWQCHGPSCASLLSSCCQWGEVLIVSATWKLWW